MPKEEWGTKRVCPTTGQRFYDMGRDPIVSPYTGEVVTLDTGKGSRVMVADKADKETVKKTEAAAADEDEDIVLDDEDDGSDVDLGDDVLEDDDEDNVSLDDIADVSSDEDES